ncbi:MAG: FkbM family methyltransferase [Bauldia sp.]
MKLRTRAKRFVSPIYRSVVRPYLPVAAPVRYAGVPVSIDRKRGDVLLERFFGPFKSQDIPQYEFGLVTALRQNVRGGDRVVIVGGGFGVTVAVAALASAPAGTVICFEGGAEQVANVRETAIRNGVAERVTVLHAVVGPAAKVYGAATGATRVAPEDLPECDLLELDCEGAEVAILTGMTIRPPIILVETHGLYGAPTAATRDLLRSNGYEVSDLGVAEPRVASFCERSDVRVLCGRLSPP